MSTHSSSRRCSKRPIRRWRKRAMRTWRQRRALQAQRDTAYAERNRLVAALSTLFPASLERHPEEDATWEEDWRWIVFVDLPTGQAGWHIHDSELPLFEHLPREVGRAWDGHTTEEKYRRVAALRAVASGDRRRGSRAGRTSTRCQTCDHAISCHATRRGRCYRLMQATNLAGGAACPCRRYQRSAGDES